MQIDTRDVTRDFAASCLASGGWGGCEELEQSTSPISVKLYASDIAGIIGKMLPHQFKEPAATFLKPWGILLNVSGRHFQILVLDWGPDDPQLEGQPRRQSKEEEEDQGGGHD